MRSFNSRRSGSACPWVTSRTYADLGAERFVGAQKGKIRIAVEIKSFTGPSPIDTLEKALGQFTLYHDILPRVEPDRELYFAVSDTAYGDVFEDAMGEWDDPRARPCRQGTDRRVARCGRRTRSWVGPGPG